MSTASVLDQSLAEFDEANARVRALESTLTDDRWRARPAEGKWSAIECVEHLNMTTRAYLPIFADVLANAQPAADASTPRMDLFGWLLWRSNRAKSKMKMKTAPHFVPPSELNVQNVLREFHELQSRLVEQVKQLESYPIGKLQIRSPFNAKIKYNVYSAVRIVSVHELRHIGQAEAAR